MSERRINKKYSLSEIRAKILNYCAKQERCHFDVRKKLMDYGADYNVTNDLLAYLIEHNFLNESRYATLYARSKFNQKKWGWNKIRKGLIDKQISDYCIREAKAELDDLIYCETAEMLIQKKLSSLKNDNIFERRQKVTRYMLQKGYSYSLIQEIISKQND